MKDKDNQELLNKYLEGNTSQEEEKALLAADGINEPIEHWFTYVKNKQVKTPHDLKGRISIEINNKEHKKKQRWFMLSGIAASLLLLIFSLGSYYEYKNEVKQNKILLDEVISMFETNNTNTQILFEDENIVIYTENNQTK